MPTDRALVRAGWLCGQLWRQLACWRGGHQWKKRGVLGTGVEFYVCQRCYDFTTEEFDAD